MSLPYTSGDDVMLEFLEHRFSFSSVDFGERVGAAAVRLGLVGSNDLDESETRDLVVIVATGAMERPASGLGAYLHRHWDTVSVLDGESLVYWLRRLVFRGAYLDQRVKDGVLDVRFDGTTGDHAYQEPLGGRAPLETAPIPSWRTVRFRS